MSWLSAILGGSNPTLNKDINAFGMIGGQATGQGLKDTGQASSFFSTLLSGNNSKINQLLAPQISGIKQRGQQKIQQDAQFGNRSGGTNAQMQQVGDNTTASVNDLIAKLTGQAANSEANLGSSLLNTGISAYGDQTDASQMRMQNWLNSILGNAAGQVAGAAVTSATGGA